MNDLSALMWVVRAEQSNAPVAYFYLHHDADDFVLAKQEEGMFYTYNLEYVKLTTEPVNKGE